MQSEKDARNQKNLVAFIREFANDNNAVVGKHPKFDNVYLATGFTGRGLMQAPGIGRALTELITTGAYQSIDISNMAVERVLGKEARHEPYVL